MVSHQILINLMTSFPALINELASVNVTSSVIPLADSVKIVGVIHGSKRTVNEL
jgi:hypothetical protein